MWKAPSATGDAEPRWVVGPHPRILESRPRKATDYHRTTRPLSGIVSFPFPVSSGWNLPLSPRFPRERGVPRTRPLASAPSTSTLVNPEAHAKESPKSRRRIPRQGTRLDGGEPGHPGTPDAGGSHQRRDSTESSQLSLL